MSNQANGRCLLNKMRAVLQFWVLMFLTLAIQLRSDPLSNWCWRFPSPQGNILLGVTYGGGQFVAVGDKGTIVTSSDGYNWTNQWSGISTPLRAVAYSRDEYAAVGDGGVILVSSNALNWEQIPRITSNTLWAVTGANILPVEFSQFLAVGDYGTAVAGNQNTNWSLVSTGTTNSLYGITWEDGWYYTVVGAGGTVIEMNNSQVNLIPQTEVGTADLLYAVANDGNGQYVAGGYLFTSSMDSYYPGPDQILSSLPDSYDTAWTSEYWVNGVGSLPPYQTLWYLSDFFIMTGFAYGQNGFVGVGYTGEGLEYHPAVLMSSTDGSNWVELPSTTCEDGLNAITYGDGLYVAVGDFGSIVVSQDTTNWTTVTHDRRGFIVAMACNSDRCIASAETVYYSWGFPDFSTIVSTNGLDWKVSSYGPNFYSDNFPGFASIISLACSSSNFVGVCSAGLVTTSDGFSWVTNSVSTNALDGVDYANGQYFAVGDNGSIYSSADGLDWSNFSLNTSASFFATAFGNGVYVAAGTVVAISSNGADWTIVSTNPPAVISKLAFGDGLFVGVSYSGEILRSSNGINWQLQFTEPSGEAFSGIAFSGGIFLAISGRSGTCFESTDGLDWRPTGTSLPETALGLDGFSGGYLSPLGLFEYYQTALPGCYSTVSAYNGTFLVGGAEGMMLQSGQLPPSVMAPQIISNQSYFGFSYYGQTNLPYRIQESTNLIQWRDAYIGTGNGQLNIYSQPFGDGGGKFFRIVSP